MLCLSAVSVSVLGQRPTNSAGYPDVSGEWMEGPNLVRISQTGGNLIATCTYGNISWRMDGTITREGVVTGRLVHTAGVSQSAAGFAQDRRMTLSADGRVLQGQSTFLSGGGHSLMWKRNSSSPPPPPPPPPPPSAADIFAGDWLGAFHCADPAGQMSTFNLVIWREQGQLLWTDWSVPAISPAVFTEEPTRYKLVTAGWDDRGRRLSYTWYIDKKSPQPLMYGESQFEAYPNCRSFRYLGMTRWMNCPAGSSAPPRKPIVK
jgi:hypothetical protein